MLHKNNRGDIFSPSTNNLVRNDYDISSMITCPFFLEKKVHSLVCVFFLFYFKWNGGHWYQDLREERDR